MHQLLRKQANDKIRLTAYYNPWACLYAWRACVLLPSAPIKCAISAPDMSSPWFGCSCTEFTAALLSYERWQPGALKSQMRTVPSSPPARGSERSKTCLVIRKDKSFCACANLHTFILRKLVLAIGYTWGAHASGAAVSVGVIEHLCVCVFKVCLCVCVCVWVCACM